jgi:hypothetical protein
VVIALSTTAPRQCWEIERTDGSVLRVEGREIAQHAGWITVYTGTVVDEIPVVAAQVRASTVTMWRAVA